ncbi:MAG: YHYH domain-containing protein [Elusimicrobia bacterium]|nr:YHYH domain-containing protein [Elusimicrobiota bacterium]
MKKIFTLLFGLSIFLSSICCPIYAHKGKTDAYGGHNNRATGTYHFHSGSLAGQEFSSKTEAINALNNSRASSYGKQANTYRGGELVGSVNSNKYHYPSCQWANKIKPSNRITFSSPAEAQSRGYVPCKMCRPPTE